MPRLPRFFLRLTADKKTEANQIIGVFLGPARVRKGSKSGGGAGGSKNVLTKEKRVKMTCDTPVPTNVVDPLPNNVSVT